MASSRVLELASKLQAKEIHVVDILVFEAIGIHNEVEQIQNIIRSLLRLLAKTIDRAKIIKSKGLDHDIVIIRSERHLQDRVRDEHHEQRHKRPYEAYQEIQR